MGDRARLRVARGSRTTDTQVVKVAISVPDPVFRAADRAARRLRIARSQLYTRALEAYLKQEERPDITERLNAVYGKKGNQPDPAWLAHGLEVLRRVEWEDSLVPR